MKSVIDVEINYMASLLNEAVISLSTENIDETISKYESIIKKYRASLSIFTDSKKYHDSNLLLVLSVNQLRIKQDKILSNIKDLTENKLKYKKPPILNDDTFSFEEVDQLRSQIIQAKRLLKILISLFNAIKADETYIPFALQSRELDVLMDSNPFITLDPSWPYLPQQLSQKVKEAIQWKKEYEDLIAQFIALLDPKKTTDSKIVAKNLAANVYELEKKQKLIKPYLKKIKTSPEFKKTVDLEEFTGQIQWQVRTKISRIVDKFSHKLWTSKNIQKLIFVNDFLEALIDKDQKHGYFCFMYIESIALKLYLADAQYDL